MNRERLESNIPINTEVEPELENSAKQFVREESTLLQKFRGKSKQIAKALIVMTALSVPAEFVKSRVAYAEEPQKIEKPEKSSIEIKKEQAQKIVEKLKVQYLDSNLLPNDCQSLIDKYGSIEVASFWLAQTKIREIMAKIQDEQGIEQGYRTDIISGDLFVGHTDHLQDIARDLEDWSVGALSKKITQQFFGKFTQETMPRDKTKEDVDRTLSQKEGIYLIENNMFASGAQLQKILSVVEKIKKQNPSSMKLKFLILEHGEGGWAKDDTIYLRSSIFNTDNIREERFKEKPEIQLGWVFGHEMGHLSFDGLSEPEKNNGVSCNLKKFLNQL